MAARKTDAGSLSRRSVRLNADAGRVVKLALVTFAIVVSQGVPSAATQTPQGANPRGIVVVSDLHMGVGRDQSGAWRPDEDFRWAAEFAAFLQNVDAEGRGATDLILNGDTFELVRSTQGNCVYADADLGCTEPDALARLDRVLAAHDAEIKALGQFARSGSNRVVFVPGDHDAALLFPSVARRVVTALAAPERRVDVAASGSWRSTDGQIYVEHGHQIGFSAHKFDTWPTPFVQRSGRTHLARPWGEQLIQELSTRYQAQYPVLTHVAEAGVGMKYGLAAGGTTDAGASAPRLLRYFLLAMSWQQFRLDLDGGDMEPPAWDLTKIRAEGPASLVAGLPNDDRFKPLATKALTDGHLAKFMDELTDDELVAVCDYRGALRRARRRSEPALSQVTPVGPLVAECPRMPEANDQSFEYYWRSRDLPFTRHLEAVAKRVPPSAHPIAVFVHGHTHLPDSSRAGSNEPNGEGGPILAPEGYSLVRNAATPVAINDGAWQRTILPVQLERAKANRGVSYQDLLRSLQPEQLAPCYTFVRIGPYSGTPAPALRHWHQVENGSWTHSPLSFSKGQAPGCGDGLR